jgi:hypothetical protein
MRITKQDAADETFQTPPFIKEFCNNADKNGSAVILPGLFLSTAADMDAVNKYIPGGGQGKNTDFSSSPYWITVSGQSFAANGLSPGACPAASARRLYSFFFPPETYSPVPGIRPLPLSALDGLVGKARKELREMMFTGRSRGFPGRGFIAVENILHSLEKNGKADAYMYPETASWFQNAGFTAAVGKAGRGRDGKFPVKLHNPEGKISNYAGKLENHFSDALRSDYETRQKYHGTIPAGDDSLILRAAKSALSALTFNHRTGVYHVLDAKGCADPPSTVKVLFSMADASRSRAEKTPPPRPPGPAKSKRPSAQTGLSD